jgi:DNA mismatch repair protein MutS
MAEPQSLLSEYISLTSTYIEKYGDKTVVLMQVGAFFEMYGLKKTDSGSVVNDVCQLCQLNTSDKKICVGKDPVFMAGFRDYTLEKYLAKITDGGYTAVVYIQEKNGKNISRVLHAIYSPGTYISCETDTSQKITNNIMCIWLDSFQKSLVYGVSVVNIFTGKAHMFEHEGQFYMNPTTFDELERCVSVYAPSEVIIVSPFDTPVVNSIIQYSGITTSAIHRVHSDGIKAGNCAKQTYIRHILTQFFGHECYDICVEFNTCAIATQSFCYLMDFIQEHNPNLVSKIAIPTFNNMSKRMVLANHTLQQLNIIGPTDGGALSSVLSFLNKCKTPMGKRLFYDQLTSPTFDDEWLNSEYNVTANMLANYHFVDLFRTSLTTVRDMEKISRQLVLRKLYPSSLYYLRQSVATVQQLDVCLYENPEIRGHFARSDDITDISRDMLVFLDDHLDMEMCRSVQSMQSFEHNIIKPGISPDLDRMVESQQQNMMILDGIQDYFNQILGADNVKKHETEKSCVSLQVTKKRATTLKTYIANNANLRVDIGAKSFLLSEVELVNTSANACEISIPILNLTCKEMFRLNDEIDKQIAIVYADILEIFERDWLDGIERIGEYVARMDVAQSKAYIARTYNYCKPEISREKEKESKSFVRAKGIRHCLIEHIQTNELYVTNDIHIGCNNQDGMLLYGTNAVGKTSLIRALGIAVILAQSGMYVPCSSFVYAPYTAIYSRILGNDNLFKGLSTFAVEMSELRVILKMADAESLVLGDEICSGTETESALSIFVSALMDLYQKKCSFVFATHFHEIIKFDEVQSLDSMVLCHMSVTFDREKDCLIYDRKLKPCPGNRMYGLEVCKSLYLEEDFLNKAYSIRNKYFPDTKGELSHTTAVYNAKKVRGLCEMCKTTIAGETHHINEQKDANDDGFIDSFHKNHPANLLSVCEKCHDKIHANPGTAIIRKKTTKGYIT